MDCLLKKISVIFFAVTILVFGAIPGYAADESDTLFKNREFRVATGVNTAGSVYTEIHVSPDGIYVVDSSGVKWEYDLDEHKFEKGQGKKASEESGTSTRFPGKRGKREIPESIKPIPLPEIDTQKIIDEVKRLDLETKVLKGLKYGKVLIEENETVKGPIFAFGEVKVRGRVKGDVISYSHIKVTSTGVITGDATAPEITVYRGGVIRGKVREYGTDGRALPSYTALIAIISILGGLLVFGSLALLVVPKRVAIIRKCMGLSFMKCFFVGLLFWLSYGPIVGLLVLTVVGIPVAALILPLATFLGLILGSIGFGQLLGNKLSNHINMVGKSDVSKALIGLFTLFVPWLLMSFFFIKPDSVREGFGIFFMVISIVLWSVVICAGVGSVILTRFGNRECKKVATIKVETTEAPPPPTPPPISRDSGI